MMFDVIKVHRLPQLLQNPGDLKAEALRAIIRSRQGAVIVEDAQSGERFTPSLATGQLTLEPLPHS